MEIFNYIRIFGIFNISLGIHNAKQSSNSHKTTFNNTPKLKTGGGQSSRVDAGILNECIKRGDESSIVSVG